MKTEGYKSIAQSAIENVAVEHIEELLVSSMQPLERIEATEDEKKMYDEVKGRMRKTLKRHGLEDVLPGMQLVFVKDEEVRIGHMGQTRRIEAMSPYASSEIWIHADTRHDSGKLRHVAGHEAWHRIADQPVRIGHVKEGLIGFVQTGVHRSRVDAGDIERQKSHFYGLNEAIAEKLNIESLGESVNSLKHGTYFGARMVLEDIINGLADHNGQPYEETWSSVVRGYVRGDYSFLNPLDATFGPGSLRIVSQMTRTPPLELEEYFDGKTTKERRIALRKQLLVRVDSATTIIRGKII